MKLALIILRLVPGMICFAGFLWLIAINIKYEDGKES